MNINVKSIINNEIKNYVNENIQLADKVYFNTGKLTNEDKNIILQITHGDNYTKIISDFYFDLKNYSFDLIKQLKQLYNDVKTYNKNVFPITEYDVYNPKDVRDIMYSLEKRRKIIQELKNLPSIAIRNLKNDIRKERDYSQLNKYYNDLSYFVSHYSLLSNRDEKTRIKILQKMFKGSNTTLDDLMQFVDDKENFIGGVDITKKNIYDLAETEDMEISYDKNNIMIVEVYSATAIKAIGCNSLWCFTYGSEFQKASTQWSIYSYYGMVYVIINFNMPSDSPDFMHVLIKPLINDNNRFIHYDENNEDEQPLFDMSNENYNNPYSVLKTLFGNNYKTIIRKYLNFE